MFEKEITRREKLAHFTLGSAKEAAEDQTQPPGAQWKPVDIGSVHFFTMTL